MRILAISLLALLLGITPAFADDDDDDTDAFSTSVYSKQRNNSLDYYRDQHRRNMDDLARDRASVNQYQGRDKSR